MENEKIAIIQGKEDKERKVEEGRIDKFGTFDEDYSHMVYLLQYVNKLYPDKDIFKGFTSFHRPELLTFVLTNFYQDILFFNTSTKKEKMGALFLPKKFSLRVKEVLYAFLNTLKDYQVDIYYNLSLEEENLSFDSLLEKKPVDEKITEAMKKIESQNMNQNMSK